MDITFHSFLSQTYWIQCFPNAPSREWSANSSSRERTLSSNPKGQSKYIRKVDLKKTNYKSNFKHFQTFFLLNFPHHWIHSCKTNKSTMPKELSWLKNVLNNLWYWVALAPTLRALYKLLASLYALKHFGHKFQTLDLLNRHHNVSETRADLLCWAGEHNGWNNYIRLFSILLNLRKVTLSKYQRATARHFYILFI